MLPCGVALVFRVLPAPRLGPEGPEGDRGSFPANAGVWQPHLEPRARARILKPPSDRGIPVTPLQELLHGALALAQKQRLAFARL